MCALLYEFSTRSPTQTAQTDLIELSVYLHYYLPEVNECRQTRRSLVRKVLHADPG